MFPPAGFLRAHPPPLNLVTSSARSKYPGIPWRQLRRIPLNLHIIFTWFMYTVYP